jgi:hypothetical protein
MSPISGSKIQVHHIGGRNGSQPFNLNPRFSRDYTLSLYDGDSSCEPSMVGDDGIERRVVVQVFAGKSVYCIPFMRQAAAEIFMRPVRMASSDFP